MKRLLILCLALFAAPASAQLVTATLPTTCNAAQTICIRSTPVTNPDGTSIGGTAFCPVGYNGAAWVGE